MRECTHEQRLIELIEDMVASWRTAPEPPSVVLPDHSRSSLSEAGAAAVIWGWTARVVRMAEATLSIHREGFTTEAAPMLRSMLEHTIALPWLVDKRGAAFQTLARERADNWARFKAAQTDDWTLEGESAALLEAARTVETDTDTLSQNVNLKTAHRAQSYGLGTVLQAWLYETWFAHATLQSAEPYFDVDPTKFQGRLFRTVASEDSDHRVVGGSAIAVLTALGSYADFDPNAFPGKMAHWEATFAQIMADRRRALGLDDAPK